MQSKIVARIVVPMLCVFISTVTLADDPVARAPADEHQQPLDFLQLFQVGQHVTLTSTNGGNYGLRLYNTEQRDEIEARQERELAEYEKALKNRELVNAKAQELAREFREADAEERDRIRAELRGLGVSERAVAGFANFSGRRANPALQTRLAVQPRPRRPTSVSFYSVSEIGTNYVGLTRGTRQLCIPMWAIRSVSRDVPAAAQKPEAKTETSE